MSSAFENRLWTVLQLMNLASWHPLCLWTVSIYHPPANGATSY